MRRAKLPRRDISWKQNYKGKGEVQRSCRVREECVKDNKVFIPGTHAPVSEPRRSFSPFRYALFRLGIVGKEYQVSVFVVFAPVFVFGSFFVHQLNGVWLTVWIGERKTSTADAFIVALDLRRGIAES